MYIGLDIGTSSIKAILVDASQYIVTQSTIALSISRPQIGWSEQQPEDWWKACLQAFYELREKAPAEYSQTQAIGLSGQMHGAVLLGQNNEVLRPAILWNDGRSNTQCQSLEQRLPELSQITGNLAMPGFTAPKLLWVKEHEPEIFSQINKVLLPKDYIRFRLSHHFASDMSDSAGTLWLNVKKRAWASECLEACGLSEAHMPELFEGSEATSNLANDIADDLKLSTKVIIAGGGGDNACAAIGIGAVENSQAFISLGTSGVYFVANDQYRPNPSRGVHAFCHALPNTWHQMGVTLSAASSLEWFSQISGANDVSNLMAEIEITQSEPSNSIFLPYLSGERTPHNDPDARGVFFGLTMDSNRAELGRAVLEGVAFSLADAQEALLQGGSEIGTVSVVGGGSRSKLWGEIIASVLQRPLQYLSDGELGPAFGASRLARLAHTGEDIAKVCTPAKTNFIQIENQQWRSIYRTQFQHYQSLYQKLFHSS